MSFTNLEQRMVHTYLDMFPPFVPLTDGEVSVRSQQQLYRFMGAVYRTIYETPELVFTKLREDDAYPQRYNRTPYGKPRLIDHMRSDLKRFDGFLAWLFSLAQNGAVDGDQLVLSNEVELKKRNVAILPHVGLGLDGRVLSCNGYQGLFDAWRWMATRENATVTAFSRCMFDPAHSYVEDVYRRLFGNDEAYERLARYLQDGGYTRYDLTRGPYTLDYAKRDVEKSVPLGDPKHGDPHHYGVSADYKFDVALPPYLVLRIIDFKGILLAFDSMADDLKDFVIGTAKQCDDCGYCTQTDKTGKRERLAIEVSHHGVYSICPLYPGFNFTFTELDEGLTTKLMAFLAFMDRHLSGR